MSQANNPVAHPVADDLSDRMASVYATIDKLLKDLPSRPNEQIKIDLEDVHLAWYHVGINGDADDEITDTIHGLQERLKFGITDFGRLAVREIVLA
jgi:hypothetical protein